MTFYDEQGSQIRCDNLRSCEREIEENNTAPHNKPLIVAIVPAKCGRGRCIIFKIGKLYKLRNELQST